MNLNKPKILLVDLSRFFLEIEKTLLEDATFQLLIATNGQQALDIVKSQRTDLIIMDIIIPRMDGGRLCAALKADPEFRTIPVIMIVDAGQPEDINLALEVGSDDYISKPLDKKRLLEKIREHLPVKERRAPRIACNIPVLLQVDDSLAMLHCNNLSVTGLFVKSSQKIPEGTRVSLSFRLPGESRTSGKIEAKGHVVWLDKKRGPQAETSTGFGIQIDEIIGDGVDLQRSKELMAFIEANRK